MILKKLFNKLNYFLVFIIILACNIIIIPAFSVFASDGYTIRVGLEYRYKNTSSIPINNNSILVGVSNNGQFVAQQSINISNTYQVKPENGVYIKTDNSFLSFEEALKIASNSVNDDNSVNTQFKYYPVLKGNNAVAIYIGPFSSTSEAQRYKEANSISGNVLTTGDKAVSIYIEDSKYLIVDANENAQIKDINSEPVKLGDRSFRGYIEFVKSGNSLTAVNVIDIEEYLYSVVGAEMPSSWAKEALKAQAVAARNYSYYKRNTHTDSGYDVCDSTHCQVYKGVDGESPAVIDAVNSTKGIMAYYNNEVINAVYCSSNGGFSADSNSVWGYTSDYLMAVNDSTEVGGKVWARTFTYSELTNLAGNIGTVTNVSIEKNSISGRVDKLILTGTNGTKVLEKENIRNFFSSTSGGSLESRNFDIAKSDVVLTTGETITTTQNKIYAISKDNTQEVKSVYVLGNDDEIAVTDCYVTDKNGKTLVISGSQTISSGGTQNVVSTGSDKVVFSGKGWGHGVGMSQFGAKSLADIGWSYDQILKHYYTGITLK